MSERERAEQVVPVWIQQEAQRCAASNGRIDPAYLTGLWRRGAEFRTVVDRHGQILTQAAVDRLLSALPVEGDTPQVCQWRKSKNGLYADSGCTPGEFFEVISVTEWKGCPYCGKPLALVPAEGDR